MNEVRNILIGFEMNRASSQIAYFDRKAGEPVSVPTKVGTNTYEFPTALAKKKGQDKWFVGFEADYFAAMDGAVKTENPYEAARMGGVFEVDGVTMTGVEILAAFIRESLRTFGIPGVTRNIDCICVTTEELPPEFARTIRCALQTAGFPEPAAHVLSLNESFCYFGYCQRPEVAARDIALIRFDGDNVSFDSMHENRFTKPFAVTIDRKGETVLSKDPAERDREFAEALQGWMEGGSFSSMFLTGEGFGTDWAKNSIREMSRTGARVFVGENLFAKGAAWAAKEKQEPKLFRARLYMGPNLVRSTLGIDIIEGSSQKWYPLIRAGVNWYENTAECELILCGRRDILVTVVSMDRSFHRNARLELDGLPERPDKATRIRLKAEAVSEKSCLITAEDLGFGELFPSSGKCWTMEVPLADDAAKEGESGTKAEGDQT